MTRFPSAPSSSLADPSFTFAPRAARRKQRALVCSDENALVSRRLFGMMRPGSPFPASRTPPDEPHHRPLRVPCAAEGRGHHASLRQPRHHRAADHARAQGAPGPHLRAGPAGGDRRRHGRRLLARQRQARRLQRACGARPRQRHGLALQRQVHRHADDHHRRPAGAGPRPHRAAALRSAGADRAADGEMGRRGDAARGPSPHRAPRRQGCHHAAHRSGLPVAAGRHPERGSRHRARFLYPRRHARPPGRQRPRGARQAPARRRAARDHHRRRDRQERRTRGRGGLRRDLGRHRLSAERTLRRPFPLRASLLCRLAVARPEAGARAALQVRSADRARRRSGAHVGVERGRAAARRPAGGPHRPASIGRWARTSPPRWRCAPMSARR